MTKIDEYTEYCIQDNGHTMTIFKSMLDKTPCQIYGIKKDGLASQIKDVIFNPPATIVFWADGTKTVVKCREDDIYDPEKGLAMAIAKKAMGNNYSYYNTFKHWLKRYPKEEPEGVTLNFDTSTITETFAQLSKDITSAFRKMRGISE